MYSNAKKKIEFLIDYFSTVMPEAKTELNYNNTYQLLIAVVLSAQCTDKRVNLVTPEIFKHFPTIDSMAQTNFETLFPLIKTISYPNNKTKHLIEACKIIMLNFKGEIPLNIQDLMLLPGVGRKTANVITSVIDKQPNMAVDTHVFRVSKRIGIVPKSASTPLDVELALIKIIPQNLVHIAHHWFILHGRYICKAIRPNCHVCGIQSICTFYKKANKQIVKN